MKNNQSISISYNFFKIYSTWYEVQSDRILMFGYINYYEDYYTCENIKIGMIVI